MHVQTQGRGGRQVSSNVIQNGETAWIAEAYLNRNTAEGIHKRFECTRSLIISLSYSMVAWLYLIYPVGRGERHDAYI